MFNFYESETHSILILNRPQGLAKDNFYTNLFKVPEILNRLRQYRGLLSKHDINIPVWVYCLTQDIQTLKGTPQKEVVNFLVSMGLYDRYISKKGWPDYILGSDPLISVISGDSSFETELLNLTVSHKKDQSLFYMLQAKSYYNTSLKSFSLTSLKKVNQSNFFENMISFLENEQMDSEGIYQFLCPHTNDVLDYMKSIPIFPRNFLEYDQELKWLWPIWRRTRLYDDQPEKLNHK